MKRVILFAACFGFLAAGVQAQGQPRTWSMGPLSWHDFVHKSATEGRYSYLEYYMGIDGTTKRVDGIAYDFPDAYAYISPEFSWADTHYRSEALLRFNQAAFGLVEIHRRQLREQLFRQPFFDGQQMVDNTMRRLADDINRLEAETSQGADTVALSRWEADISRQLMSLPAADRPSHVDAPFRWAFSMDGGVGLMCGQLHHYFSHGAGLGLFADMGLWRHFLIGGFSFAGSRAFKDLPNLRNSVNDLFVEDPLSVLHLFAAYGYAVVDNARYRITPFVGYGLTGVYFTPQYDGGSSVGPTSGSFYCGVDFNRHITNQVEWFPFGSDYNARHDLFSFNARLFATYDRFVSAEEAPRGLTVNLLLGFGFTRGRALCR